MPTPGELLAKALSCALLIAVLGCALAAANWMDDRVQRIVAKDDAKRPFLLDYRNRLAAAVSEHCAGIGMTSPGHIRVYGADGRERSICVDEGNGEMRLVPEAVTNAVAPPNYEREIAAAKAGKAQPIPVSASQRLDRLALIEDYRLRKAKAISSHCIGLDMIASGGIHLQGEGWRDTCTNPKTGEMRLVPASVLDGVDLPDFRKAVSPDRASESIK